MRYFMMLLATLIVSAAAQAAGVPRYDPAGYCREVGDAVGGSATIERGCIQQEQRAYDRLKANWTSLPARARSYCDEVAQAVGSSYVILAGCIDQEVAAEEAGSDFEF